MINVGFADDEAAGALSVQLTAVAMPPDRKAALEPAKLKEMATASMQQYVESSMEKKIDLKELKSESAVGFYATLTDASANPGRYKCVTGATVAVCDLLV